MNRQAVPVSGTGHALVDLAGVVRVKSHGEMAAKSLTNYVYDDGNSIKFPSEDYSKTETVCASKSSETKEDTATPKTVGSLKQGHWILDKKNKQRITPRKALFTPTQAKECPTHSDNISRERTTESLMRPRAEILLKPSWPRVNWEAVLRSMFSLKCSDGHHIWLKT